MQTSANDDNLGQEEISANSSEDTKMNIQTFANDFKLGQEKTGANSSEDTKMNIQTSANDFKLGQEKTGANSSEDTKKNKLTFDNDIKLEKEEIDTNAYTQTIINDNNLRQEEILANSSEDTKADTQTFVNDNIAKKMHINHDKSDRKGNEIQQLTNNNICVTEMQKSTAQYSKKLSEYNQQAITNNVKLKQKNQNHYTQRSTTNKTNVNVVKNNVKVWLHIYSYCQMHNCYGYVTYELNMSSLKIRYKNGIEKHISLSLSFDSNKKPYYKQISDITNLYEYKLSHLYLYLDIRYGNVVFYSAKFRSFDHTFTTYNDFEIKCVVVYCDDNCIERLWYTQIVNGYESNLLIHPCINVYLINN